MSGGRTSAGPVGDLVGGSHDALAAMRWLAMKLRA